jgi:hypothetical protein
MKPTNIDQWLELLGFALKAIVEKTMEIADVEPYLSRYTKTKKSYVHITLHNEKEDEEDDDIYVSANFAMEDAVSALINKEYKSGDHAEICRDVAADFRQFADQLDAAADATTHQTIK